MEKKYYLTGKQFGSWTVLCECEKKDNERAWLCRCACGRQSKVKTSYLTRGKSKRCSYCNAHAKRPYSTNAIPKQQWDQILRNAKKRNISVDITPKEAYALFQSQNGHCALSGWEIRFAKWAGDVPNATASLDRINNGKGYEAGNIQWIHKDINRMKNVYEQQYFIAMCKAITNHQYKILVIL